MCRARLLALDADGQNTFWSGTHNYSWGLGGLLADSSGSTTYTPGFSQRQGTTDRFFHTDWLGSTRYLSDGTGNSFPKTVRYSAFGERTFNIGSDPDDFAPFQFVGGAGYQSEHATATEPGVGLQLLGERYYDPAIGRFISPDPIGFAGGLNLYGYVDSDPTNGLDPSGLVLTPFDWVILGYDAVHLGYSVYRGDWRGAAVDTGIFAFDALLTTIPGAPPAAGATRLALIFAQAGARPAADMVGQLALGVLLRTVYYTASSGCPRGGSGSKQSAEGGGSGSFADEWSAGTFPSQEASFEYHYEEHRNDAGVSATNKADFARKALNAKAAALSSGRTGRIVDPNKPNIREFPGTNKMTFIYLDVSTNKIVTFGAKWKFKR